MNDQERLPERGLRRPMKGSTGELDPTETKTKLLSPPKVTKVKKEGGTLQIIVEVSGEKERELFNKGMSEALGVDDLELQNYLLTQCMRAFPLPESGDCTKEQNLLLALLHDINPKSATETLLATQMIHTHNLSLEMMSRAKSTEQSIDDIDRNVKMATKLTRMFTQQLDVLQKLRGKGQQKITVEHVNVNEGGQAIVGDVSYNGGGG